LGAVTAAGVATHLAERRTVGRWRGTADPHGAEPVALSGDVQRVTTGDGAVLRVVSCGSGPPVVLAHGFTATADHWAPVAVRLQERGLRVIAFDQRGHGRSTSGDGGFAMARLGDDLADVLDATAAEGAVVVGHSMGGMGVQAFVRDHPDRAAKFGGVVLAATLGRPSGNRAGQLLLDLGGSPAARRAMAHPIHGRLMARASLGREVSIAVLDLVRSGWSSCPDATRAAVGRELQRFDAGSGLAELAVPVTVVCGNLDRITPLAESRWIASRVPGARLVVAPGVGHQIALEAADLLANAIADLALPTGDDP
jgi:pimeloyl-ACP methyl ester carboxylesterase